MNNYYLKYCLYYLYKPCTEHNKCFQIKHNDDTFLQEMKFIGFGYCVSDKTDILNKFYNKK